MRGRNLLPMAPRPLRPPPPLLPLLALALLLAPPRGARAQSTPCPANSDGAGDGAPCICGEGFSGAITYNDAETPPTYEGACEAVKTDYFLGLGWGCQVGLVFVVLSLLAFSLAGKTSFECATLTNFGLIIFWALCALYVAYAPREGELSDEVEIDSMWWARFGVSLVLYVGAVLAIVLVYVKDVLLASVPRKTRVIVR